MHHNERKNNFKNCFILTPENKSTINAESGDGKQFKQ